MGTQRSIFCWIHIIFSIPILGYIYSPFEKLPGYAPPTRYVFLPVMVLSGLWMWKGHVLRRLVSKRSAQQDAADNPSRLVAAFTRRRGAARRLDRVFQPLVRVFVPSIPTRSLRVLQRPGCAVAKAAPLQSSGRSHNPCLTGLR
jgi:hypothetical protein